MDHAELKSEIRKVMVDHLTELGYPDISDEDIMAELKPMWVKIEEAGLIQPGMSFPEFCLQADAQYTFAQLRKQMGF